MTQPYTIVIGLEVHVQLLTREQAVLRLQHEVRRPPNTQTCPVCIGMPGTLPVMNRRAFELSAQGGRGPELPDRPLHQVGPQELLLSRPAQGLSDQPIRPAASATTAGWRSAIPRAAFEPKRDRHHPRPPRRRRRQEHARRSGRQGRQPHRPEPRRHAAVGNRQPARHAFAGRGQGLSRPS